ncbi:MAG TPA: hypothetical protein VGQ39_02425 [Pyrinomonadaceae bacterium]|jgi:hypothetical protein|nr:hypothetical protein [Pyrinomonadaceae bacterium]
MQPTKYNLPLREWDEKKKDIVQILTDCALMLEPAPLTYSQLCQRMKSPPIGESAQNSIELRGLLDEIDRHEAELGNGMLTSFVFAQDERSGQPFLPGRGFFSLAEKLGYIFDNTEDGRLQFAIEQMQRVSNEKTPLRAKGE